METILLEKETNVAKIILNRPDKLNALSPELIEDLIHAMSDVEADNNTRAIVVTGAGRAFSAGGDVQKDILPLSEKSPSEFMSYMTRAAVLYRMIFDINKPVIAAVNGHAVGAGLDLAMACDIRIASDQAQVGEFFVRMGLTPEVGLYLMPRLIGLGKAKLLCFTGDLIGAADAERMGLVDKVVTADELIPQTMELAGRLANGPVAISYIKKGINQSLALNFEGSLDAASQTQYQLVHTEDHKEAVSSFLEKRKPDFKGR
ncbi:MAG: enoyl-CoA hydratase/isomerase family protein [Chloroflexota bacterium]|nr:enoyl-CoA hydratase/isomerase family protein [Chloroflexota bacterium]